MIRMIARHLLFVVAGCLGAGQSWAQVVGPPSSALVKVGQTVDIIDDQGRETHGKVKLVTLKSISLDGAGLVTQIPIEHITQIARPKDGLGNGAWIGFSVGAGLGFLSSVGSSVECAGFVCVGGPRWVIMSTLVTGAVGAAIGVGVDALIHRNRVLYRRATGSQTRMAPLIGPDRVGGAVAVTW